MDKYLKMTDMFCGIEATRRGNELVCGEVLFAKFVDGDECEYAVHAINSHDELVAEVERLTKSAELAMMTLEEVDRVLTERIKNGAYDLDDISGEVTYALDKLSAHE